MMFRATSPENATIVQKLSNELSTLSYDQIASYERLSMTAGRNIKECWWLLKSAIERVEKNSGAAFETVRGVGIKKLLSGDAPQIGLVAVQKVRRIAKRGKNRIDRLNTNSMSDADRSRAVGYSAMLGAIALVADGRKAEAVGAAADPNRSIPPENILEMFRPK